MRIAKLSKKKILLSTGAFTLLVTLSASLFSQEQPAQPRLRWLKGTDQEKFSAIEQQFAGTYISMARVGYRYNELFFAGQDENWEFAKYQTHNIRRELQNAFIRRPNRAVTAAPFMEVNLPLMDEAIDAGDKEMFMQRFNELTQACNACHLAQDLAYLTIQRPTIRRSPVIYGNNNQ